MFNRRGVSAVVANVLIILLVVVGVALIWAAVRPSIEEGAEGIGSGCFTLNLEPLKCEYYPGTAHGENDSPYTPSGGYCWAYPVPRGEINISTGINDDGINCAITKLNELSCNGATSVPGGFPCFWIEDGATPFSYKDAHIAVTVRRNAGEGNLDGLKLLIKGDSRIANAGVYGVIDESKNFLFEKSISGLGELETTTLILDANDISESLDGAPNVVLTNLELANIAMVADNNVCDVSTSPVSCTCKNDGLWTNILNQNANLCNYPDNLF
jgi:hypothetical protein